MITHTIDFKIKGKKYRVTITEWVCTIAKQCPNLLSNWYSSPESSWGGRPFPIEISPPKVRIQNLSTKKEGTLKWKSDGFKSGGIGFWIGANPDYKKKPYAFHVEPLGDPALYPTNLTRPLNKNSKLIGGKCEKLLSGLNPLVAAKRRKEAEDKQKQKADDADYAEGV